MKQCLDKCPNCGCDNTEADNIDWGEIQVDGSQVWQSACCHQCNTTFAEIYRYAGTEIV